MPCDLEVDTDLVRRAAGLLGLAAEVLATPTHRFGPVGGAQRAAEGSAAFREAARLAAARADQCFACTGALAARADQLSALLREAAASFERAELLCTAGR